MQNNLARQRRSSEWIASKNPLEIIEWALDAHVGRIALSTSLGPQTLVILDMVSKLGRKVPVFVLDTGFLFPETQRLWADVARRYGIDIQAVRPMLTVPRQAQVHGEALWKSAPDRCCHLRKVVPLAGHLAGYDAWMTGLRRDQSATRSATESVEWDDGHGLVKVNPLAWWTRQDVQDYARDNDLKLNPLLSQGFRSIGCTHCTHRVDAAHDPSDERAGRWSGSEKTECGIHPPSVQQNLLKN